MKQSLRKQLTIKAPPGQFIDLDHFNSTKEIKFIPEILEFPTTWGIPHDTLVYYIDDRCKIGSAFFEKDIRYQNSLTTKEEAEQMLIFM